MAVHLSNPAFPYINTWRNYGQDQIVMPFTTDKLLVYGVQLAVRPILH